MAEPAQHAGAPAAKPRGRVVRVLAVIALIAVLLELGSYLTLGVTNLFLWHPIETRGALLDSQTDRLRALLEAGSTSTIEFDPVLGWYNRHGYTSDDVSINQAGLRAAREYSTPTPDSLVRVAAFGDSFVLCNEVSNEECWTWILEEERRVEVLNYGVSAYATDQAFLLYQREGRRYEPRVVIVGFAPVDLLRVVNRYRPFLSPRYNPLFKPRFKLVAGELQLIPPLAGTAADMRRVLQDPEQLSEAGNDDYWYDPATYEHRLYRLSATYRLTTGLWSRLRRAFFDPDRLSRGGVFRPEAEAFVLQTHLMLAFADSIAADGAKPVMLFLPSREDVVRYRADLDPTYGPLRSRLRSAGLPVIDPLEAFGEAQLDTDHLFAPGGHYSPAGNRLVADVVALDLSLPPRP